MIRALYVTCVLQLACAFAFPIPVSAETDPAPAKKEEVKRKWGTAVGGQAISIATEKAAYAPEEAIVLNAVFKNVGQDDVYVTEALLLDMYRLTVLLPSGKEAPFTLYGKRAYENWRDGFRRRIILKPGQQKRVEFALSRLFDFSLAGEYTVFVQRDVLKQGGKEFSMSKATSNRIKVIVDDSLGKPVQESLRSR